MIYVAPEFEHLDLGDIVSVKRPGYIHEGLVFGFDDFGAPVIGSIARDVDFFYESFNGFMRDQNEYWSWYPSSLPSDFVLKRALFVARRPYHAYGWNCQRLVRYAHGLDPRSPDAEAYLSFAAFAGATVLAAKLLSHR